MRTTKLRQLSILVIAILATTSILNSCEEDMVMWDFYPNTIIFKITDASGKDLLDPNAEGSLFGTDFTLEYEGQKYALSWPEIDETGEIVPRIASRYYPATFYGIKLDKQNFTDKDTGEKVPFYVIYIGDFPGDESYDHTMTMKWDNGQRIETIRLTNDFSWKHKNEPLIDKHLYYKGEDHESFVITLIK